MIFSYRVYTSPDEKTWSRATEGFDNVPKDTDLSDYTRKLVARFDTMIEGDDAIRVGVWVGELTENDEDAEISLDFHWRDDVEFLLDQVRSRRNEVDRHESEVQSLKERLTKARYDLSQARVDLNISVYHASRGGALQTDIVDRSGHERNWVRTTVQAVAEQAESLPSRQ